MSRAFQLSLVILAVMAASGLGYVAGGKHHSATESSPKIAASDSDKARKILYWYDPMKPEQRFDKPGKSPFMDMDLLPRYADEAGEADGIAISARQQQNLGVKTQAVQFKSLQYQMDAYGTVTTDERSKETIPASANGIVEKLFVKAPDQFVTVHQALALLWIPEWTAAQQEYLAITKLGDPSLTAAARQRLQLQFMPEAIIRTVETTHKPQSRIMLRATKSGYVSKLNIQEGAQVSFSQPLFELASLNPVWIVISYPESQAAYLTPNSAIIATSSSWPGKNFYGKVSELLPNLDIETRTLQARVILDNPSFQLKPGMYVNVRLTKAITPKAVLAIPEEALILTGSKNIVLVSQGQGYFKPVEVVAGLRQNGWVEIKEGLSEGQSVVTSGQFLIDSEANLRSALPQMAGDKKTDQNHNKNESDQKKQNQQQPVYSGEGIVKAISHKTITLSHKAIPALKWPAMTMDFMLPEKGLPSDITVGKTVMFRFILNDSGARIIDLMLMNSSDPMASMKAGGA
ncbi:MAG: efflux RND transporter periplasmic adaptor subunit [Zymomonas mobilis subsp. pomaceae]|uniref:Efflux transporter, RND family, MFP subunit n=1 Tax=Zymomonas mobilis subsp. pomaceae (strain ATCC 29192 / DSM 22645 / JCM 10191 / CCUG 17912 / NBRC 13757 / NCIMB 11200 / NRRL B-4491 / Barker I) TaxID=579138 RepID=F8EVX2_ZYMMT|nr:efflux RND transporter periplasmic adaptor subunit [Zymomonas mobilis]AEI37449.1 efflux transporter, RND family, MFP subunit [Zymomonas mobilis subsp. pomaceae ATCC 29192]MDX5948816.1 efflux RND transporter periplasmic adaptor subunit [Zymomonas mobilis subsp. pomaceae]GEB88624.1 cobalt transporter [Zymomonas mobilis subsp. pomaceae]